MSLLAGEAVSRVGLNGEDGPEVLPVNHLVVDGIVYFRTAPGTKLAAAAAGDRVVVEADHYDAGSHAGWSVVAKGTARIVTDEDELERVLAIDFEPWAAPDIREFWVAVDPDAVTGRRLAGR